MISNKLLWTGLTIMVAFSKVLFIPSADIVGAIIMSLGLILYWLDK